ncbi:MAG TPA: hypothetical protein DEQ68_06610 [Ruminococcaceae bacterium]|nr:hypothetical protein [Oscillospiraceae bacterium]
MKEPSINQYLLSTCLFIIDELNEQYSNLSREKLKTIADDKFNEMDITVRLGYPFKQMVHYTVGDGKGGSKVNHDLYVESKDFKIEIKYLKNWKCNSGTNSASKTWSEYQKDFDWLIEEINKGYKYKRAFVIGWFNCVDSISQYLQLGSGAGSHPLINEARVAYFPFLRKTKSPTHTSDLAYNYERAYSELSLDLIGETNPNCNCLFLGNQDDVFHFAVYY